MSDVVDLLKELIAIDSVNPELVAGGAGEAEIAAFAHAWLDARGFTCRLVERAPGRTSVLAVSPGSGGGRSIMLNGHIDTVALSSYDGEGLRPVVRDGSLFGRGSYDMKSGVAAIMVAAATVAAEPHAGDIVVALVADEEWASAGTEDVLRHVVTDTAVVVEPSGLDLVIAHRGFVWAEVTVHGRAAHGSRPDLGIDAIAKAGRFLVELDELGARLAAGVRHPLLATGSVHASTIEGGTEASSYPDRCRIVLERRTVPGEDVAFVEDELRGILDRIASADADFSYDLAITGDRPPFAADEGSQIAAALAASFAEVTGMPPRTRGEPFWTDCALLSEAGIDTVLFGVDGGGAHAATEWVTISSLDTVVRTLELGIRAIVG
ncbi:ArgE/DapE family deacylase [Microbacterium sp. NPDC055910]|uniref:ArgE/DapE family deacylase n=1 Tax=Microbacterium sp. NPDC055910 TaxID=3345659 RepID=UPI0035DAC857